MRSETHPMPQASKADAAFGEAQYLRRMHLIQRWRRTALLVCLLLASYALLVNVLDPTFLQPSGHALVESLLAFIIAIIVAVNFLTFRLRK